ncbi:MAG: ABC transporter ATP-binding protein [Desulfurococcaceae archaeon]
MGNAVEAKGLFKTYRVKKRSGFMRSTVEVVEALRGVSFTVRYGEVVGLLGPNGAGKTTTIKILATLLLPDKGEAIVAGYDVVREPGKVRRNIGMMLTVEKGFYGKLTGRENLEYFAALYGLSRDKARERIDYLIKLLELDKLGGDYKLFEEFSLGMKARLSLARALISDAPVLLLDEPTLGLDPPSARRIRELVRELAHRDGKAILYTTHNMFEAEMVCDRIIMINRGQVVVEGSPQELKARLPKMKVLQLLVKGNGKVDDPLNHIKGKFEVKREENDIYRIKLHLNRPEDYLDELLKKYMRNGFEILSVNIEEPTLEDVFIYFSGVQHEF